LIKNTRHVIKTKASIALPHSMLTAGIKQSWKIY